uniref:CSC1/OSCA1-like 7TM region domain-containing protein n=1 Tax=Quercus lobata TaxID=97700 RepID=A0A7N2LS60_QUELO
MIFSALLLKFAEGILSFVGYGLELSRVVPLIIYHLKRKYLCKTESELKEASLALDLGYGTRVPSDMLVFTIVLCYSVMGPIIIPFGVIYFGLGWLILRNQFGSFGMMEFYYAPFLIPLIILSLIFGYVCSKKFYQFFHDTSREVVCDNLMKSPNMEKVFRSYIPPSLSSKNIDDDQ